jgi:hypothetical protein
MNVQKIIKNFQVKLYLEAWVDNVGFHSRGPERTLHEAMQESQSLIEWFKTDNVDYDEDFAMELINKEYKEYLANQATESRPNLIQNGAG